jgi:hypothetical protein
MHASLRAARVEALGAAQRRRTTAVASIRALRRARDARAGPVERPPCGALRRQSISTRAAPLQARAAAAAPSPAPRAAPAPPPLSAAGRASVFTGAYISLAGAALLAAPLRTLGLLFACDGITAAWIRVFGILCGTFGSYYLGAAALEARGAAPPRAFYRATVAGRLALCAAFCALVAGGGFPQRGLVLVRACGHCAAAHLQYCACELQLTQRARACSWAWSTLRALRLCTSRCSVTARTPNCKHDHVWQSRRTIVTALLRK